MTLSSRPPLPPLLARALPLLVTAAVPLAAILAFSVQPLLARQLLPIYGGAEGVWPACVAYFQLALLLGYLWAAWLARQSPAFQTLATAALGLLAALTFHLPAARSVAPIGVTNILIRLSLTSLPALVLLFSASPLLHHGLQHRGEEVPYYLYAVANLGALAALWLYPFAIEPSVRASDQGFLWHGLLIVVAALLAVTSYFLRGSPPLHPSPAPVAPSAAESTPSRTLHLALPALTCIAVLGATGHFVGEIGSNSIAWVGPLGLYLLSFMIAFSGRWRRWMTLTSVVWLLVSLCAFMISKGFTAVTVDGPRALCTVSLLASACFLGHALLHETRPSRHAERFYITLAAGGLLGALLSAAVIPRIFPQRIELALAALAVLTLAIIRLVGRREFSVRAIVACILWIPLVGLGLHQSADEALGGQLLHRRDLHGPLMLKTDDHSVVLSRDSTTHATQITFDAAARRHPTLYYTESSAVGRALQQLQQKRPRLTVGILGLNGGTLAAYARADDTFDFWDLDPQMHRVARESFSYLADSAGHTTLFERDGRDALAASRTDYDLIVVDAFVGSGDSLPEHLLTREALKIYLARLAARDGLLLVNVGARYTNFFPLLEATAHTLGRASLEVVTRIQKSTDTLDWDPTRSDYTLITVPTRLAALRTWFPLEEDGGRVKRELTTVTGNYLRPQFVWHDDRHAPADIFAPGRLLAP